MSLRRRNVVLDKDAFDEDKYNATSTGAERWHNAASNRVSKALPPGHGASIVDAIHHQKMVSEL